MALLALDGHRITLEEHIESWLINRAARTRKDYREVYDRALRDIGKPADKITYTDALRFISAITERGCRPSTVRNTALHLSSIFAQLKAGGFVTENHFAAVVGTLKKHKPGAYRPTRAMPETDVARLLESVPTAGKRNVRDRAFLALLFGCGLRVKCEALALRVRDVETLPEGRICLVLQNPKGGDPTTQDCPKWAATDILRLLNQRLEEGAAGFAPLLCNYQHGWSVPDNRPVCYTTARYWWCSLLKRVNLPPDKYTIHSARATAITTLLDKGVPHRKVRNFSRHQSIQMVDYYDKRRADPENSAAQDLEYRKK